jgi:hypothetical protein
MSDFNGEIEAEIEKVGELLAKPNSIQAPPYQRSFAWTREEAGKLLEDISSAMDEAEVPDSALYFLGNMLFIDRDTTPAPSRLTKWARARPARTLDVVDGFQRLTTLTILFCVLRDLDASKGEPANGRLLEAIQVGQGESARPRLSLRTTEDAFFVRPCAGSRRNPPENRRRTSCRRLRRGSSKCATISLLPSWVTTRPSAAG